MKIPTVYMELKDTLESESQIGMEMLMLGYVKAEDDLTQIASWIMKSGFELFVSPDTKHSAGSLAHLRTLQEYLRNEFDKLIGFLKGNKHFIQGIMVAVSNTDSLNDCAKCCDRLDRLAIWIPDTEMPVVTTRRH